MLSLPIIPDRMKQKVVMKVSMNCQKLRSKAMRIAAGAQGVESVELQGDDKNQIAVTGDGIDSVVLTMLIRKRVGCAELVSVTPIQEKKKEKEKKKGTKSEPLEQPTILPPYQVGVPRYYYEIPEANHNCCTIM